MGNSDCHFTFASSPNHHSFVQHETLPLQLLKFNNRGLPWPTDQHIQLRHAALPMSVTINNLILNCTRFAIPKLAISGSNRFVLHFGMFSLILQSHRTQYSLLLIFVQLYPFTAMTSFGDADTIQLHTCLLVKTYFKFTHDHADGSSGQVDEPSSDDDNSNEETEVFWCRLQL